MKVLFAASVYNHLAAFHKPFMKMFQEKGYEVHAACSSSSKRKEELEEIGVICHDVNFRRIPFSRKNMNALKVLNSLFKEYYFDLIHVHTPTAAFLTRYAASKHQQGKILYTAHGFHFFKGASKRNWLFFYTAEKVALRWTDGLIVMNNEDYMLGKKIGFKENENLHYVHGVGVDLDQFNTEDSDRARVGIKKELNLENDAVVVICIAELSARKNQKFLLENWRTILDQCPNAHLIFIGDGGDITKIKEFIFKKKLKHVHLLGYRKDVPYIILASDIVTLVSIHEGLPRCLMEGMASGKPIVTTNVRGSRDLVDHGSSGIVVNLGDKVQLIKRFTTLIKDKQLRVSYGGKGHEKIQEYNLSNVLKEMDEIYSLYL